MKLFRFCTLILAVLSPGLARADWGNLSGQFILDGDAPKPPAIQVTKDPEVCGKHNLVDESVVVSESNKGVAGVVICLYLERNAKAPAAHPDYEATANEKVHIDNKDCRFSPHVVLVRTTQTLVVGNSDAIGHNSKIDTTKNTPINPIIPANQTVDAKFPKEERLPCPISCSIHPWMKGYVVIKDSPYMAVSDADGKFEIKNLPTGKWKFQVWQESVGYVTKVNLGGKAEKWAKGQFDHEIAAGENNLGEVKIDLKK